MNVSLECTDKVNGVLTAVIEPADYAANYKKAIQKFRKQAQMPGFRAGKVPEGLIKKKYGREILGEEVNKILNEEVSKYIRDNKVNMLGELLPRESDVVELEEGNTFTLTFDVAIAPGFKVELGSDDTIISYDVQVSDELVERQVNAYRQRDGHYDKVEEYQDNDMVRCTLVQLDEAGKEVEDGLHVENAVILPNYIKDETQKKLFDGKKLNDVFVFNPSVAYNDNAANVSSLLKIKNDEAVNYKGDFQLTITEITRYQPGPLNEELFSQIYPNAGITTEEQFRARIKGEIKKQFDKGAEYRFVKDLKDYLIKKVGKLEFPDEKLKKIMQLRSDNRVEMTDEVYEMNILELTWHLIKEQLVEKFQIKVDDKDITNMAAEATREQFAQYGMLDIPQQYIDESVRSMLEKRETVNRLVDTCIEKKIGKAASECVTLETKEISTEDFNNLSK